MLFLTLYKLTINLGTINPHLGLLVSGGPPRPGYSWLRHNYTPDKVGLIRWTRVAYTQLFELRATVVDASGDIVRCNVKEP